MIFKYLKLRTKLFSLQFAVFAVSVLVVFLVFSCHSALKLRQQHRARLVDMAHLIAGYLKANPESLAATHLSTYKVIVIGEDGNVLLDRQAEVSEIDPLWESYRSKLIYEMHKQKNGWIFYPQTSQSVFFKNGRVIYYQPVEGLKAILGIETKASGLVSLWMEALDPQLMLIVFLILVLGWFVIRYSVHLILMQYPKLIEDRSKSDWLKQHEEDTLNLKVHPVKKKALPSDQKSLQPQMMADTLDNPLPSVSNPKGTH